MKVRPIVKANSKSRKYRNRINISVIRTLTILSLLVVAEFAWSFDHHYQIWGEVLTKYSANGRVDYQGLSTDRSQLDTFIVECGRVPYSDYESWALNERMAFVINLYNAAAIQLILNHWPLGRSPNSTIGSINEIGGWTGSPWNIEFINIFGHVKGLGHLENDILRPSFKDPRIHFAIVPAALGGPWLRSEPFLPLILDDQLWQQERLFMTTRPEINRYEDERLHLSPIFDWYSRDFGLRPGIVIFARRYFSEIPEKVRIEYSRFDWSLNVKRDE